MLKFKNSGEYFFRPSQKEGEYYLDGTFSTIKVREKEEIRVDFKNIYSRLCYLDLLKTEKGYIVMHSSFIGDIAIVDSNEKAVFFSRYHFNEETHTLKIEGSLGSFVITNHNGSWIIKKMQDFPLYSRQHWSGGKSYKTINNPVELQEFRKNASQSFATTLYTRIEEVRERW